MSLNKLTEWTKFLERSNYHLTGERTFFCVHSTPLYEFTKMGCYYLPMIWGLWTWWWNVQVLRTFTVELIRISLSVTLNPNFPAVAQVQDYGSSGPLFSASFHVVFVMLTFERLINRGIANASYPCSICMTFLYMGILLNGLGLYD